MPRNLNEEYRRADEAIAQYAAANTQPYVVVSKLREHVVKAADTTDHVAMQCFSHWLDEGKAVLLPDYTIMFMTKASATTAI